MREYPGSFGAFGILHLIPNDMLKVMRMIDENRIDDAYLIFLNAVIYRHKYNWLISIYYFPILTEKIWQKYEKIKLK